MEIRYMGHHTTCQFPKNGHRTIGKPEVEMFAQWSNPNIKFKPYISIITSTTLDRLKHVKCVQCIGILVLLQMHYVK